MTCLERDVMSYTGNFLPDTESLAAALYIQEVIGEKANLQSKLPGQNI
jgi:hypothetical protein